MRSTISTLILETKHFLSSFRRATEAQSYQEDWERFLTLRKINVLQIVFILKLGPYFTEDALHRRYRDDSANDVEGTRSLLVLERLITRINYVDSEMGAYAELCTEKANRETA
jgi:hypothetical protein